MANQDYVLFAEAHDQISSNSLHVLKLSDVLLNHSVRTPDKKVQCTPCNTDAAFMDNAN
jgi:hypothetical protein